MSTVASIAGLAITYMASGACQTTFAQTEIHFNLPTQPLRASHGATGLQTHTNVLFDTKIVSSVTAPELNTTLTREAPLIKPTSGTGLEHRVHNQGTVIVAEATSGSDQERVWRERSASATSSASDASHTQTAAPIGVQIPSGKLNNTSGSVNEEDLPKEAVPEILVQGSRVLNTDIRRSRDDAQPYVVFDRDMVERSGAISVEDFLKNHLTMATNVMSPNQQGSSVGNKSSFSLRGLGANQTLILVDGRRIAGPVLSGVPQQPDLNGIPISAVERIEVLPATASGIYGGGATGGVINVVLRRDYNGVEIKLSYGNTFKTDVASRRFDIGAGFSLGSGKTHVMLAGALADSNQLLVGERDLVQRGRQHILQNNPSFFTQAPSPPLGSTTNIRSVPQFDSATGQFVQPHLTLKDGTALNSTFTHVPLAYSGVQEDGGLAFIENAGKYNLALANTAQSNGLRQSLLNSPTIESLSIAVHHELTASLRAFVELNGANNSSYFVSSNATGSFTIPGNAPNNPFEQTIRVTTPIFGADGTIVSTTYNRRALAGAAIKLRGEWQAEIDYTWERTRLFYAFPAALSDDAATAVQSGAIDLFRDTNLFHVDFSPFIDERNASVQLPVHTTLRNATFRAAGPIGIRLLGGKATVTFLAEVREELFDAAYQELGFGRSVITSARSQSVNSAYVETTLPLVSAGNSVPGVRGLELQLAARLDDYRAEVVAEESGDIIRNGSDSIDPTIGLKYQPTRDVMFRASYGTGYLPPGVNQLVPFLPVVLQGSNFLGNDPRRGGEPVGEITYTGGGDPNLKPEESESWSIGIVATPRVVPGLRMSVDWTRVRKRNNIATVATLTPTDFDNEAVVDGLIVRGPVLPGDPFDVGPVIGVSGSFFNIAKTKVDVYDLGFDYQLDLGRGGEFDLSIGATRLVHLKTQLTPLAAEVENAGVVSAVAAQGGGGLNWKANGTLTWRRGDVTLGWTTRYFGSYWLNIDHSIVPNQGAAKIDSQIYHDLYGSYHFAEPGSSVLHFLTSAELQVGVRNVFNKRPPIDVVGLVVNPNGYSLWGDPRLASYYVSLRLVF